MQTQNTVKMKILADGAITVETDGFQGEEAHMQAEELIKETFEELGGESKVVRRKDKTGAAHVHQHQHVGG